MSGGRSGEGGSSRGGHSNAGGSDGTGAGGRASGGANAGGSASGGQGPGPSSCGEIVTFEAAKSPARELHVATNGNDSGDGSAARPFATIDRALQAAMPGTAVRVHPGTYSGDSYAENLAGTPAAPIWVGGMPGAARPVIEGGSQALHLVKARFVIIHDLEISGQSANGINVDDGGAYDDAEAAHSIIFRDLSIHDVGASGNQDCLKLSGLNDYYVLDTTFARCGGGDSGSAIDHVGCHDGLIARNQFDNLTGGGNAVQCKGGSQNIEIRWNRIRNGGQRAVNMGGSTGFEFFRPALSTTGDNAEARDIRVIANLIQGGVAALGFVGCVDCLAANNTIIDPENWVLRILQETTSEGDYTFLPAQDGRFINNLVYFSRADVSTTINVGPNTSASSFTFQNNLWFAHDQPNRSTPTDFPAAERDGIYAQAPSFTNAANGDFSLAAASPASGAGVALPEVSGDLAGNCYADPPSIGAFEAR